jgi:hypothetical protein
MTKPDHGPAPLSQDATTVVTFRSLTGVPHQIGDGWKALASFVAAGIESGDVTTTDADSYAVLDVLDKPGNVIQSYGLRTRETYAAAIAAMSETQSGPDHR